MEYNTPVSNPMLVGAFHVLKTEDTPQHRKLFMRELVDAKLMTPVSVTPMPIPDEEGKTVLTPQNKVMFPMLPAPDGEKYFLAFTDKVELSNWRMGDGYPTMTLSLKEYASMILCKGSGAAGFILNPRESGLVITKEILSSLINPGKN